MDVLFWVQNPLVIFSHNNNKSYKSTIMNQIPTELIINESTLAHHLVIYSCTKVQGVSYIVGVFNFAYKFIFRTYSIMILLEFLL